jgi:hypothetical protein
MKPLCHPERSVAESKKPVDFHFEASLYPTGSLDSARDDKKGDAPLSHEV